MKDKIILGLDIGSANLKYVVLDSEKREVLSLGCIPLWTRKMDLLKKMVGAVGYIERTVKPSSMSIVTSFEITEREPVHILEEFYGTLLDKFRNVKIITITKDCSVIDVDVAQKNASQFIGSAVQGAAYVGMHVIDTGILVAMNSASTIVLPIIGKSYCPVSDHKFSSGGGRWIGALYTPVENVINRGIVNGRMTALAPYGAHTVDIFNILHNAQLEEMLSLYGVDRNLYPREGSFMKVLHSLACFSETITEISMNQARIFSLYVYYKLEDIIREMTFQTLSALDLDTEKTPITVCGIGKDLVLKNALRYFRVQDIESYVPFPLWSYTEAFGGALALLERAHNQCINITEVTLNAQIHKKNQDPGNVQF